MVRFGIIFASCVLLTGMLAAAGSSAPTHKRALLVAVSRYNRGHEADFQDLHTKADVTALKAMLQKLDFDEITVLESDAETTHDAILRHFRTDLIDKTQPGDIVYFHYSGHGARVPDPSHRKPNGKHECLVPSDYVSEFERKQGGARAKIDWGNYILDDNLRDLLKELEPKQPGNVTLSFDSCYSGTITRGETAPVRGVGDQIVTIPSHAAEPAPPALQGTEPKGPGGLLEKEDPSGLGYVVISATTSDQQEPETRVGDQWMGLLSWALAQALANPPDKMTYRELAERLRGLTTQRYQDRIPQVEGYLDREVLGTTTHVPEPYVPVRVEKGQILLSAGRLHGVTSGSRFAIYPLGTLTPAGMPLAETTVGAIEPTIALLELDAKDKDRVPLEKLNNTRAFEKQHRFADDRLRVDTSAIRDDTRRQEIARALAAEEQEAVQLVSAEAGGAGDGNWDVRILPGQALSPEAKARLGKEPGPHDLALLHPDGTVFHVELEGPEAALKVVARLAGEARWRFLKGLQNPGIAAPMKVAIRLLKANPTSKDLSGRVLAVGAPSDLKLTPGAALELSEGDYIQLEIRNEGELSAYVTVLDLRPDGTVGPVFPYPGLQEAESNLLAPKQSFVLPLPYVFRMTAPFGTETFKVIATDRKTDFSFVFSSDTARGMRGELSPLQKFLQSARLGTRAEPAGANPSAYAVHEVTFVVKPKGVGGG